MRKTLLTTVAAMTIAASGELGVYSGGWSAPAGQ